MILEEYGGSQADEDHFLGSDFTVEWREIGAIQIPGIRGCVSSGGTLTSTNYSPKP